MSTLQNPDKDALLRFRRHVAWALMAFLVALTVLALRNVSERNGTLESARNFRLWATASEDISRLVHELQRERGMSSGYIASGGKSFSHALADQRARTDSAWAALAPQLDQLPLAERHFERISQSLAGLPILRGQIQAMQFSREYVVDSYTQLIEQLFDLQLASFGSTTDSGLMRQQIAFMLFVQSKERSGLERALIASMLADGNFSAGRIALWQSIRAVEAAHLASFRQLADPTSVHALDEIEHAPDSQPLTRIRQQVQARGLRATSDGLVDSTSLPPVERWFALSSSRIDAMKALEDALSRKILDSARQQEEVARESFFLTFCLALLAFTLALLLALQMRRSRQVADWHLNLAESVIANSVEAIMVTDTRSHIIDVNPAFERITGFSRAEALGQTPRLLRSGRHDSTFYETLWQRLTSEGAWQGDIWNRRKNGEIFPGLLSIAAVRDQHGEVVNYTGMLFDLSQQQRVARLIDELRTFDGLTGLPNREAWLSAVSQTVANAQRSGSHIGIVEFDIDRFKLLNDTLGHAVGDQVLIELAERIKNALRRHDIVARASGNRFSILLTEIAAPQDIGIICEKLMGVMARPFELGGSSTHLTASMGAAIFPEDGDSAKTLMMAAESALYSAKAEGRASYKFYAREMNELGAQLFRIERMLRQALAANEFSLVYQPQIAAADGRLIGVEVLLRWQNPELGNISPVQFIPIAEETGLIVPIGEWVMRQACRQAKAWHTEFAAELPVAVNLSARQFGRNDLLASVWQILEETGLPPRLLELEITEGLLIADPAAAADLIRGLHFASIKTALDDFGTGYSSLSYLKTFPLNRLKIDRSFVRDLPNNASDRAIANTIITLGHQLSMEVLAEGVETEAQAQFLRDSGCHAFQGYLFAKPMPAEALTAAIRRGEFRLTVS